MVDDRTGLIGCRNTVGVPGECMIDDKSGGRYENLQILQICDSFDFFVVLCFTVSGVGVMECCFSLCASFEWFNCVVMRI